MSSRERGGWQRCTLILVVVLSLAVSGVTWGIRNVGYWLIVADPLSRSSAIVVFGGDFPFRAIEAASLYRQGWAPAVWLVRTAAPAQEAALARLGFEVTREEESNRAVLRRLGVAGTAVRVLDERAQNTVQEVQLVAAELKRGGQGAAILVTSKSHSRRLRATWRAIVGDSPRAFVRFAGEDPFDPRAWWRNTRDALAVSREILGLLNAWAGFPVQPAAP